MNTFQGFTTEARNLCDQLSLKAIRPAEFLERCSRLTSAAIGCSRTGIWVFVETSEGSVMRCLSMYDATEDRMKKASDERREVQPYFAALERDGYVSANDADYHPATNGLAGLKAGRKHVRSLLACSFAVNGHLFGAFTCTQIGARKEWTPRQLAMLRQIGGPASLALYRASRHTLTTGFGLFMA